MAAAHLAPQSPARRAWRRFRANRMGYYSLVLLTVLFVVSLMAEVLSNDKPLIARYGGQWYFPVFQSYPETTFGGDFPSPTDYLDPAIRENFARPGNIAIYPPNPYHYSTINYFASSPSPSAPDSANILGTDDKGRDLLARLLYGFRLSLLFALVVAAACTLLGVAFGAVQGFFAGWVDLVMERLKEVWAAMPVLVTLIPFEMAGAIGALTSLDFLGLGVPPGTPSLGELLNQGKENLDAWWISVTTFGVLVWLLLLLILIGDALRDALDPRKVMEGDQP